MTILSSFISPRSNGRQIGYFSTNGSGDLTTTLSANASAFATVLQVASSAGFDTTFVTVPGSGVAGADSAIAINSINLTGSNRLGIQSQLITGVSSGLTITKFNKVACDGTPRKVEVVNRATGDRLEWVKGMPYMTIRKYSGSTGAMTLLSSLSFVATANGLHFGNGVLDNSATYDFIVEY